jgi:hypothetical protein
VLLKEQVPVGPLGLPWSVWGPRHRGIERHRPFP